MDHFDKCVSAFFVENSETNDLSQNTEFVDICVEVDNVREFCFENASEIQNEEHSTQSVISSDPDLDIQLYNICEEIENK